MDNWDILFFWAKKEIIILIILNNNIINFDYVDLFYILFGDVVFFKILERINVVVNWNVGVFCLKYWDKVWNFKLNG